MRKLTDFRKYETNPFGVSGLDRRTVVRKEKTAVMVTDGGEGMVTFKEPGGEEVIYHDEERYVKLFRSGMTLLPTLSTRGLTMLFLAMSELVPRKNTVVINRKKAASFSSKLAGASYYIAMAELLEYGVIARARIKNTFYVNPNIAFNGDRRSMICDEAVCKTRSVGRGKTNERTNVHKPV